MKSFGCIATKYSKKIDFNVRNDEITALALQDI